MMDHRSGSLPRTEPCIRRAVELVEFSADSIVISRGLSAGEKVVTAGVVRSPKVSR